MMDRFGKTNIEDLGLETSLQKVLYFETQDVIELHFVLFQHSDSD